MRHLNLFSRVAYTTVNSLFVVLHILLTFPNFHKPTECIDARKKTKALNNVCFIAAAINSTTQEKIKFAIFHNLR